MAKAKHSATSTSISASGAPQSFSRGRSQIQVTCCTQVLAIKCWSCDKKPSTCCSCGWGPNIDKARSWMVIYGCSVNRFQIRHCNKWKMLFVSLCTLRSLLYFRSLLILGVCLLWLLQKISKILQKQFQYLHIIFGLVHLMIWGKYNMQHNKCRKINWKSLYINIFYFTLTHIKRNWF